MASASDRSSGVALALDAPLVIDAIPAIAWSSQPDGSVELVNRRWLDYTGLSPEESYGWGWKTAVHVEDLAELLTRGERATFKRGAIARSDCGALTASSIGFLSVAHHCTMKRVQWCGGSELAFILKTASKKNCFA